MTTPTTCTTPPDGWACSRPAGHTGPCAATPLPGHSARLYGAINNLMAHIGAHGSVDSDHQLVDDTMQALKAVDGGTFQPGLATEAAAMAATVPAEPDARDQRIAVLEDALRFYADGTHFGLSDKDAWDTVSGEPQNWWCDEAGTATIEDGTLAAMALKGQPLLDEEDEVAPQAPVAGQPAETSPADQQRRDAILLEVGRQMLAITTTVRGEDEWLAIPGLWSDWFKEYQALKAAAPKGDSNG